MCTGLDSPVAHTVCGLDCAFHSTERVRDWATACVNIRSPDVWVVET